MRSAAMTSAWAVLALVMGLGLLDGREAEAQPRGKPIYAVLQAPYNTRTSQDLLMGLKGVSLFSRDVVFGSVAVNVDSILTSRTVPVVYEPSEDYPRLTISIAGTLGPKGDPGNHMVTAALLQPVVLARSRLLRAELPTWIVSSGPLADGPTGEPDEALLASQVEYLLKQFAAAYRLANP